MLVLYSSDKLRNDLSWILTRPISLLRFQCGFLIITKTVVVLVKWSISNLIYFFINSYNNADKFSTLTRCLFSVSICCEFSTDNLDIELFSDKKKKMPIIFINRLSRHHPLWLPKLLPITWGDQRNPYYNIFGPLMCLEIGMRGTYYGIKNKG